MMKRTSTLLLATVASSALAQDIPTDLDQPEVRRYTVEIIIFSYAENAPGGNETFVPDLPPELELPATSREAENTVADSAMAEEEYQHEFLVLAEKDFTLHTIYEHLQRLDAYDPLMHFAWTQSTYPDQKVEARALSSFTTPPNGLEGELTLYLSRYLHLAVKLQLDATAAQDAEPYDGNHFDFREEMVVSYPVRYRIDEDRIFRNGDLRYFDHPKFGVLAKITRNENQDMNDTERPAAARIQGSEPSIRHSE